MSETSWQELVENYQRLYIESQANPSPDTAEELEAAEWLIENFAGERPALYPDVEP